VRIKLPAPLIDAAMRVFDVEASTQLASLESRALEYAFAVNRAVACGRGRILDVGCTSSRNYLPVVLAFLDFNVVGLDTRDFLFRHPRFEFVKADIRDTGLPGASFDCVCAISTLEHIGLSGRYGVDREDPEGALSAVREIGRLLRAGGAFVLTLPFGRAEVVGSLHRVYDGAQLDRLVQGWDRVEERYFWRDESGIWTACTAAEAGAARHAERHGLALLHVRKG
jgi:SAM-dependent methyltransferase